MLEGLSAIRWDQLEHAYGDASDVPDLLRGLASPDAEKRQEALQTLYRTIWHQGTVYTATRAAVPFLCELLRGETVKGQVDILGLLLAIHSAYPQENNPVDPLWRGKRSAREIQGEIVDAKCAQEARQAVVAEVGTYLSLLNNPSPAVRATAAFTVACCGKRSAGIRRELRRAMDTETHAGVKAAFIFTWYRLSRVAEKSTPAIRTELLRLANSTDEKPVVRLVSAIGLAPMVREKSTAKLVRFLARTYRQSTKALSFLSRCRGSFSPMEELSSTLRLELCLELAKKPHRASMQYLCYHLERLCRENRRNFERVIPIFGQLLSVDDSEYREQVAHRHNFEQVIPFLGQLFTVEDSEYREHVAYVLSQLGSWNRFARAALVRALQDSNLKVALWSAVALSKLRDSSVLPFILDQLAPERHADVQMPPVTSTATPIEMLHSQMAVGKQLLSLRLLLNALQPFGGDGRDAVPHLRVLLMSRGASIQKLVCLALAAIGEPASDTVPFVAKLLQNRETQCEAASALLRWGAVAAKAIPEMIAFFEGFPDADSWVKSFAMEALGLMGAAAEPALPVLNRHLHDPDFAIKCAAALAIWRIAPQTQSVIDSLIDELQKRTQPGWAIHGCAQVIETLEALGPSAKPARPILEKLLDDPDAWARVHSARTLWKIGTDPQVIIPVLTDDLFCRHLVTQIGVLAAECLADIGPPAAVAIPRIQEILARDECLLGLSTCWAENDEAYRTALMYALTAINGGES